MVCFVSILPPKARLSTLPLREDAGLTVRTLPTRAACPTTCFFLMDLWEGLGGGMARVSVFDPRLNAGAYITKDLAASDGLSSMEGFHESGKVSWGDCRLTIANSVWKAAARQLHRQEDHTRR